MKLANASSSQTAIPQTAYCTVITLKVVYGLWGGSKSNPKIKKIGQVLIIELLS